MPLITMEVEYMVYIAIWAGLTTLLICWYKDDIGGMY